MVLAPSQLDFPPFPWLPLQSQPRSKPCVDSGPGAIRQIISESASGWGSNWAWVMGRLGEKFCTLLNHHGWGRRRRQRPPRPLHLQHAGCHTSRREVVIITRPGKTHHRETHPSAARQARCAVNGVRHSFARRRPERFGLHHPIRGGTIETGGAGVDRSALHRGRVARVAQAAEAERARATVCRRLTIRIGGQAWASHSRSQICCGCFVTTFARFGADSCAFGEVAGIHESRIIANV